MSNLLKRNSSITITVAASDKLAVYSKSAVNITKAVGYPNFPETESLVYLTVADIEYVSAAFTAATEVTLEAGNDDVYYNAGTAPVITERLALRGQPAPGVLNATGAMTAAMMLTGIVTSTTAAAVAGTTPTGAVLDAAVEMEIGESFDFSVIATGANAFTVTAGATGITIVGTAAVATATSGVFRVRKTAAATFVIYRIG